MDHPNFLIAQIAAATAAGVPRTEIELMPVGEFTHMGTKFTVTAEDLQAFADDLNARDVPIDYDHSFFNGAGSEAAGWFVKGSAKVVGDRLVTGVRWTAKAAQQIAEGAFRFISPEFSFKRKNQTTGKLEAGHVMHAAGLTNRPFFTQLAPLVAEDTLTLAASDEGLHHLLGDKPDPEKPNGGAAATDPKESHMKGLAEVYGLKADASEDEILAAAQAAAKEKEEQTARIAELEKAQVDPDTLKALTASAQKGEEAHKQLHDERRDNLLAAAVAAGKILPTQKDIYGKMYDVDPQGTKDTLDGMAAAAFPVEPQGGSGTIVTDDAGNRVPVLTSSINGSEYVADAMSARVDAAARKILADAGKLTYTEDDYLAATAQAMSSLGIDDRAMNSRYGG